MHIDEVWSTSSSAKESYVTAKEPCITVKLYTIAKQPCIFLKELFRVVSTMTRCGLTTTARAKEP